MNYLREYGSTLIDHGYKIIPIKRGCKAPLGVKGWTNIEADLNQLGQWNAQGFEGVGILCKDSPAIDIDILDEEVSEQMRGWVQEKLPGAPVRVGKWPKQLLSYRTDTPFKKVRSATYEDSFGDLHAVEILGDGQQYVAYAEHPDTLKPYTWHGNGNGSPSGINEIRRDSLPLLTLDDARAVVQEFEALADAKVENDGWVRVKEGTNGSQTSTEEAVLGENFTNLKPRVGMSDSDIHRALHSISKAEYWSYENWVKVGMALWHETGGSQEGLDLWIAWSERDPNFVVDRDCRSRWSGFRPNPGGRCTTMGTVLRWARDERMQDDPMGEFNGRFVYVADGDAVHDLEGYGHDKPLLLREFRNMTANIRMTIQEPRPLADEPDRVVDKVVPVHSQWLISESRKTAQGFEYVPGGDTFLQDIQNRVYINTFHMPIFPDPCPDTGKECIDQMLGVFFRHMEYIIPIEVEREWFYSWMAFNIQRPGIRCKVTPLLIATDHGTGRGWVVQLMALLLGNWNCKKTKMAILNGESGASQFQEFMDDSLLCSVEEIKDGKTRYGVTESIRDYLTESTLEINVKYGTKNTKRVFTNFLWMSNHTDAIILKDDDRRINVFKTEADAKGTDYYERLYRWLEAETQTPKDAGRENINGNAGMADGRQNTPAGEGGEADFPDPAVAFGGVREGLMGDLPDFDDNVEGTGLGASEDREVYDRAGLKVSAGVACLWHWLNRRDLSGFNWQRSMHNETRAEMIQFGQTDVESSFWRLCKNPPYPVMTLNEIQETILAGGVDSGDENSDAFLFNETKTRAQIKKLVQQNLTAQMQVKIPVEELSERLSVVSATDYLWIRGWGFEKNRKFSGDEVRKMFKIVGGVTN
tara:strand:- start:2104 stop:4707 length:2604 start_codon:yes stop_codon:yes gene_type:complete